MGAGSPRPRALATVLSWVPPEKRDHRNVALPVVPKTSPGRLSQLLESTRREMTVSARSENKCFLYRYIQPRPLAMSHAISSALRLL
jgi:hypothetical protein